MRVSISFAWPYNLSVCTDKHTSRKRYYTYKRVWRKNVQIPHVLGFSEQQPWQCFECNWHMQMMIPGRNLKRVWNWDKRKNPVREPWWVGYCWPTRPQFAGDSREGVRNPPHRRNRAIPGGRGWGVHFLNTIYQCLTASLQALLFPYFKIVPYVRL